MPERMLTLAEAAQRSRGAGGQELAEVSLRAAAARGALKARKQGKKWMVTETALREYLSSRPRWFKPRRRA